MKKKTLIEETFHFFFVASKYFQLKRVRTKEVMSAFQSATASANDHIERSFSDTREYRCIKLPNNFEALLIHDPTTDKASACIDVKVGSMSDPVVAPGLAHFLEHMLFLGTKDYPIENQYSKFLSDHGGHSNAYTSLEDTVYYFDINHEHLNEALKMFSSFFICPLFSESGVERELNAVDSEHSKNLQSDTWRSFQLLRSMARTDHPFSKFSTGNLDTLKTIPETLGIKIRDLVIQFYESFYSANVMKLVVYGKEPLDKLEEYVTAHFSATADKNLDIPKFPSEVFSNDQLGSILYVVPVRDVRILDISFPISPIDNLYLSKPTRYLAHLIGHESKGSILSALKSKGLADNLNASVGTSLNDFACFSISIELTDEGFERYHDVISCIFAYIGLLKLEGPKEWIGQEIKDLSTVQFRYLSKTNPCDYCVDLANGMHTYIQRHFLSGNKMIFDVKVEDSIPFLDMLTPSNAIFVLRHKSFTNKTMRKEKWYKTDYSIDKVDPSYMSLWTEALTNGNENWKDLLKLPVPNPFIPQNFDIKKPKFTAESDGLEQSYNVNPSDGAVRKQDLVRIPRCVMTMGTSAAPSPANGTAVENAPQGTGKNGNSANESSVSPNGDGVDNNNKNFTPLRGKLLTGWLIEEDIWQLPKFKVIVLIESLSMVATPVASVLTELLVKTVKEVLNDVSYYADCAGLYYDINVSKGGIELSISGYNDKLPVLLSNVLAEIKRVGEPGYVSEDMFNRVKSKLSRDYYNYLYWQPYYHCIISTATCLESPRWTYVDKYYALSKITLNTLVTMVPLLLSTVHVEVLGQGNMVTNEFRLLLEKVVSELGASPLPLQDMPIRRQVRLLPGIEYIHRMHSSSYNKEELNSAVENLYIVDKFALQDCTGDSEQLLALEALCHLVAHLLTEPAFDELRTKEQLGYIVFTGFKRMESYFGIHIIVQSNHKSPDYLNERIESFLLSFRDKLTEEAISMNIAAVCDSLLEKPKNMEQDSQSFWNEVANKSYIFDRKPKLVQHLKSKVQLSDVLMFYDRYVLTSTTRKKFSSQFYGAGTSFPDVTPSSAIIVEDPAHFKECMSFESHK